MKGQAGALPFLEHALLKLWEMRDGRRLMAKAYMEMGRLGGALDSHAEEFFTRTLSVEEQSLCRQLLVDLVHPGEGAADTKKRVSLDDVAPTEAARAVLKKLADARLVTTDRDDRPDAAQAELSHEALISGWRRLGEWVNENREKSRLKERLLDAAREWQKNGKKDDFLYRGAQLAAAEESFTSSGEPLPKLGREFLETSIAVRHRGQQERQRQQHNRQRLLATALAVFALLAVAASAAAIFGFWQKGEAERQKVQAEKEEELAIKAEQSAKEQTEFARLAQERTGEVASQESVSLARYSQEAGNNAQVLAHLAQALRLNQRNYEAAAFIGEMLAQTGWPLLLDFQMRHNSDISWAQFSPDGQRVVTASEDKTVRVWDAATGKAIGEPMKHDGPVSSAQFSPDGKRVVSTSDNTARLWDAATGKAIGKSMEHNGAVTSVHFSPDGNRAVTTSEDKTARLCDAATGKAIGEPMIHDDRVRSAQFSPDGKRMLTVSGGVITESNEGNGPVRLWDAVTGKAIGEPMKHDLPIYSAQFSPDGQRIVTASMDNTARLWDAATGKAIGEPMKHDGAVTSARFSPDDKQVVTTSEDKMARLWDAATGEAIGKPMEHDGTISLAQFSPDGQRIVTASWDKTARLWDAATGKAIGEPMKHDGPVTSALFSPDGQRIVSASLDKTARLWDAAIGEPTKHGGAVSTAQFSPDGKRIMTTSDNTALMWDVVAGKAIDEPMKHDGAVSTAQFSPDGQRIVTATLDQTARLWDSATRKAIGEPMKHDGPVSSAQFSPDGKRVVTTSDNTAWLWDAATGKVIAEAMIHKDGVTSAQFSPDSRRIVSASLDWTAQVWDAATGKAIGEPMKHDEEVSSAQFSPDGQRVVTASADKTARVWDTLTITREDSGDDANLLADLAEATGGVALQPSGLAEILTALPADQVIARREKISAKFTGKSSGLTPLQRFLKWSVSGARTRTISPFSDLTDPDWVENRIKEGTLAGLRAAMQVDPANARLVAHFGLTLANLAVAEKTDPDDARRALAEADYQTRRALKLDPDNDEVRKLRDEVVRAQNIQSKNH